MILMVGMFAAPEVLAQEKRGFSTDVFSLGCVLIEVMSCSRDIPGYEQWSEEDVPRLSAIRGFSYQANIDTVTLFLDTTRFAGLIFGFTILPGYYRACIRSMISTDPKNRPEAKEVATVMAAVDGKFRNWYECDCEDVPAPFQVDVSDGHLDGDSSDGCSDGEREELDEASEGGSMTEESGLHRRVILTAVPEESNSGGSSGDEEGGHKL